MKFESVPFRCNKTSYEESCASSVAVSLTDFIGLVCLFETSAAPSQCPVFYIQNSVDLRVMSEKPNLGRKPILSLFKFKMAYFYIMWVFYIQY